MNRRKKINETLKAKAKKRNAKLHKSNKPKYISKAERAQMAEQQASVSNTMDKITFYQRFEADILSGKKTITIRDENEKGFIPGSEVKVATYEDNREFADIRINSVEPINFEQLSEEQAEQENMSLEELKTVIREIYPNVDELYLISFDLL